uniref:NADH-ubiquinone oxidoreductase chain 4L n=1 Tax=Rhynchothorax sp. JZ-2022 TaxID=2992009 RepID=A0A9E7V7C3_9CHEL|nr:NADH dehydrogenase subunit 4L [Rhynchothorax sp. JZ-2022]
MLNSFIYWVIMGLCLYNFMSNINHLLCLLLSLEFFMLMIYMMLAIVCVDYNNEFYMGFYYLTISVCDGGLGLALLVIIIRSHGSEMVNNMIMNL